MVDAVYGLIKVLFAEGFALRRQNSQRKCEFCAFFLWFFLSLNVSVRPELINPNCLR